MKTKIKKRQHGQFFTENNPFNHKIFKRWAHYADLPKTKILEPFAGKNSLMTHLKEMKLCYQFSSFDLYPQSKDVKKKDTLSCFPKKFDVCVTNPPWLAKNSATIRGLDYPKTHFDNLYKYCLDKCLLNCKYVAALIPESFIRSDVFHDRLWAFISLTSYLFNETTQPVGLALFKPEICGDTLIYSNHKKVGLLSAIKKQKPIQTSHREIRFNAPDGNLGLIALDNTKEASIRFCDVRELRNYKVKRHGRHITKLAVSGRLQIEKYNKFIYEFRKKTCDVLLTSYRGLRRDGQYRRRMDWGIAKGVIDHA